MLPSEGNTDFSLIYVYFNFVVFLEVSHCMELPFQESFFYNDTTRENILWERLIESLTTSRIALMLV